VADHPALALSGLLPGPAASVWGSDDSVSSALVLPVWGLPWEEVSA